MEVGGMTYMQIRVVGVTDVPEPKKWGKPRYLHHAYTRLQGYDNEHRWCPEPVVRESQVIFVSFYTAIPIEDLCQIAS